MKDKHISIEADNALMREIVEAIREQLVINPSNTRFKLISKFIFYLLFCILFYVSLFTVQQPILFILCYIGYGFASLLLAFNFAHDGSHNTLFKEKIWNGRLFVGLYTLVGAHGQAWRQRHIHSHHYAPNVEEYDSDLQISNLIRVIPDSEYLWFHRFQHIYAPIAYLSYSLYWVFIKDFVLLYTEDEYGDVKDWQYHFSFWLQKVFYLGYLFLIPLFFAPHTWIVVILGFFLMHLSQSLFLLFTFFITHHVEATAYPTTDEAGNINTSWLMNQIKSSNDFFPFSETANFIFGGFNNHIAHHLFPHIASVHYPKLNIILYNVLEKKGIYPNKTTFFGGIRSHLKHLRNLSVKPVGVNQLA